MSLEVSSPRLVGVNLGKQYKDIVALDQVSFQLSPGECLGLAGHNGSGKSTLLSIVSQTLVPDHGDLQYGGQSVLGDTKFLRQHIGYIPQDVSLLEDLTVNETLSVWRTLCGAQLDGLQFAIEQMRLGDFLDKRVATLSGGMKKRVSIALALMTKPNILLMDEVDTALDPQHKKILNELIQRFLKAGGAILYCSHQKEDLLANCHRLLILKEGRVVFYDTISKMPEEIALWDSLLYLDNPEEG